jgi:hypothetical protein
VFLKLCGISHHRAAIGRENTRELLWDDLTYRRNKIMREREAKRVCVFY